jgi:hypothetical protein
MPKKPLSAMTAQEFIEAKAALGFNRKQFAQALNRRGPTITGYENGHPIPVEVTERIRELIIAEREKIKARDNQLLDISAGLGSMIVYQNEQRRQRGDEPHRTAGRFMRRQRTPDTATYPAYRMSRERFEVYVLAIAKWTERVRELARQYTDEQRQRDYQLELRDLQQMAATAPRNAPYDVCIQRSEWHVVSRALRHLASVEGFYDRAHALRCHWCKHKGAGFPRQRHTAPAIAA